MLRRKECLELKRFKRVYHIIKEGGGHGLYHIAMIKVDNDMYAEE